MMDWIAVALLVLAGAAGLLGIKRLTVATGTAALLYRNGVFSRELSPGLHRWFDLLGTATTAVVPTTKLVLPAHEVTVMTKDQFSFKIGLTPICQITQPQVYYEAKPAESAHWPAQFGLGFQELTPTINAAAIEFMAGLTLDSFLADPKVVIPVVRDRLGTALPGAELRDLLITSITMPPEIRKMFTEVERAKREGLAALERARGETASLRALANAARSLQANPQLAQLRMLQTMESAKGAKTFVLGGNIAQSAVGMGQSGIDET
jgi:regulator of protease activity HflC (stomatin/prohibitin superfamily)